MNVVVYTAIFGNIDRLWSVCPTSYSDARWVCFTDKERPQVGLWGGDGTPKMVADQASPPVWEQIVLPDLEDIGPRRMARGVKTRPHLLVPDADAWVWVDGNVRPLVPPEELVKEMRGELAIFRHPDRKCLYDEAAFCAKVGKDDSKVLKAQMVRYEKAGMPHGWGLPETRCVVRLNTDRMRALGDAWWGEIEHGSLRDQVSIPFVCWKAGVRWDVIPGHAAPANKDRRFWYRKHGK